ncbi:hypothetical protein [Rariglobus hedericola]|uniref:PEP-CTERM sorting domain-containing protein n=1 Tax=Rariglobus hedericola TaxID=2597822 RepID=A0A556QS76_9BACT|nr:hypothetical protein [Rariglobus hedericola]TSJ79469.1 hypothetical protein FPL22_09330 [Rariglobus hedericola]
MNSKRPSVSSFSVALATLALATISTPISLSAATVIWGGSSGEYTTGANWTGGSVPNTAGGDTAVINGGAVTYTAGGDLAINNGGTLQINGGSWTQAGGISWIQLGGGTLHVTGGAFNQGTAGNLNRNATSAIIVSGGTASLNGNYTYETAATGTLSISGSGTVNIGGEFSPINTFTLSGGTLNIGTLISFSNGPGTINLSGGTISVNGASGSSGFYAANASQGINFSTGSSGTVVIRNSSVAATSGLFTNGSIQYNGTNSASQFNVAQVGGDVFITNISAIPEPSAYAALVALTTLCFAVTRRRKHA